MKAIDFRTTGYFSPAIIFLVVILMIAGLVVVLKSPVLAFAIFLISTIIFTTHYRLRIDFDNKIFHDYLWILGLKKGDNGKFERIDCLFIRESRIRQTMNHLAGSSTLRKDVYEGYLKFSETNKIHLATYDSNEDLTKRLKKVSALLIVKIIDYSDGDPKEI